MNVILIIGIFVSFFQFVLLYSKRSKSLPDKILAKWMLVLSIHLTSYYIYSLGYWEIYPHLIGITVPFPFFYGPLLYLYIYTSLKKNEHLNKKDYFHFLPIVLLYLYMCEFYFFYSAEEKKLIDAGKMDYSEVFTTLFLVGFILSGLFYSIYANKLLKKYNNLIHQNFSNTEHIHLNWLKSFIKSMTLIFLTITIIISIRDFLGYHFAFNLDYIFYSMMIIAVIIMGYFGIRHENIFVDHVVIEVIDVNEKSEYKKSGLKEDVAKKVHKSLLDIMETEKLYLEPKLTLYALSEKLKTTPNHLSQVINIYENQNFNDFINRYRINEFIQRVKDNQNYSYLAHALDSGFNSKSTFNAVFKKQKGVTPSEFISTNF